MEDFTKNNWYWTYDEVIHKAQAIQPQFAADLPLFTAYDPWYSSMVNLEIISCIHRGLNDFSENNWLAEIQRTTQLLDINLINAIHYYEQLSDFVFHGFNDPAVNLEIFGYSEFAKARHSVKKMIALLNNALSAISFNNNESILLSALMPPELPLEMASLATSLNNGYSDLKFQKKQHLRVTRERIDLYNSLWDTLSDIWEDAKIIFAHDPQHLALYELFDTEEWNVEQAEMIHLN